MKAIVQFTHPGPEHGPDNIEKNHKDWNTGNHRRKFLQADASYVDGNKLNNGRLMFWGEWEPPSHVQCLDVGNEGSPRWLHTPYLPKIIPESTGYQTSFQNTDPYIFENAFKYFVCRQITKRNTSTKMSRLDKGSLILFGSGKGNPKESSSFQLDTVFVVADYIEYDPSDANALSSQISQSYMDISYKMAFPKAIDRSVKLRLYIGATFENQVNGMYSFVPSKLFKGESVGFPRVGLKSLPFITDSLKMGFRAPPSTSDEIKAAWTEVRDISRKHGCLEGVRFSYETK